jgi:hypothetical protein
MEIKKLVPVAAKRHGVVETAILCHDREVQPAVASHATLASMVPDAFPADFDLHFLFLGLFPEVPVHGARTVEECTHVQGQHVIEERCAR